MNYKLGDRVQVFGTSTHFDNNVYYYLRENNYGLYEVSVDGSERNILRFCPKNIKKLGSLRIPSSIETKLVTTETKIPKFEGTYVEVSTADVVDMANHMQGSLNARIREICERWLAALK